MAAFLALSLLPVAYGGAYLLFSIRKKRRAQAAAVAVPLLLLCGMLALLLWEYLRLP